MKKKKIWEECRRADLIVYTSALYIYILHLHRYICSSIAYTIYSNIASYVIAKSNIEIKNKRRIWNEKEPDIVQEQCDGLVYFYFFFFSFITAFLLNLKSCSYSWFLWHRSFVSDEACRHPTILLVLCCLACRSISLCRTRISYIISHGVFIQF